MVGSLSCKRHAVDERTARVLVVGTSGLPRGTIFPRRISEEPIALSIASRPEHRGETLDWLGGDLF